MSGGRDDVQVKFGADTRGVEDGAKRTAAAISGLQRQVKTISGEFRAMGAQVAAALTVAGITNFLQDMADWGDQIADAAMQLGVTTERVSELAYIANASGDSLESISKGMERLGYNATKAAAGSETEADAFRRLGVSVTDAEGKVKSMDQLLLETADSFSQHANGAEKVALAIQLFGRAGVNMIPILNEGRAGFERLEAVALRTGTVLSAQTVAGMVAVQQSAIEVKVSFQGIGVAIFNTFQPAILGLLKTISELIQHFTSWINESYATGGAMRYVGMMAAVVVSAIMTLVAAFELLWDVASAVLNSIGIALGSIGKAVAYALAGQWGMVAQSSQDAANSLVKTWSDTGGKVAGVLETYKNNIKEMWDATLNPPLDVVIPSTQGGPGGGSSFAGPTNFAAQNEQLSRLRQTLGEVNGLFQSTFTSSMGGFDKAISGLITGTMDWRDALLTVADSIWSTFIKLIEDWVVQWLAGEATMLVAHQSANAAKLASDMATENASAGKMIMDAIQAIFVSSKQTAAGVTANLAPTLGPAAIPAGLAAGAAVAGLASFDRGSWELDRDQVARVHKGEMIGPAAGGVADQMRSMLSGMGGGGGGGGGATINFNGPVMDKASLARTIAKMFNANPDLRPGY